MLKNSTTSDKKQEVFNYLMEFTEEFYDCISVNQLLSLLICDDSNEDYIKYFDIIHSANKDQTGRILFS